MDMYREKITLLKQARHNQYIIVDKKPDEHNVSTLSKFRKQKSEGSHYQDGNIYALIQRKDVKIVISKDRWKRGFAAIKENWIISC